MGVGEGGLRGAGGGGGQRGGRGPEGGSSEDNTLITAYVQRRRQLHVTMTRSLPGSSNLLEDSGCYNTASGQNIPCYC